MSSVPAAPAAAAPAPASGYVAKLRASLNRALDELGAREAKSKQEIEALRGALAKLKSENSRVRRIPSRRAAAPEPEAAPQ